MGLSIEDVKKTFHLQHLANARYSSALKEIFMENVSYVILEHPKALYRKAIECQKAET